MEKQDETRRVRAAGRFAIAKRSSSTFVKRQKEMARKEKQRQKMERRLERRNNRALGLPSLGLGEPPAEDEPSSEPPAED